MFNKHDSKVVLKNRIGTLRYMAPETIWHPRKRKGEGL